MSILYVTTDLGHPVAYLTLPGPGLTIIALTLGYHNLRDLSLNFLGKKDQTHDDCCYM